MKEHSPPHWEIKELGKVVKSKKGKKPSSVINTPKEGFIPYILIDEMEGMPIRYYTNDPKVSIAEKSDVLLVWDGSIGKCATGIEGAIGSTIVAMRPIGIETKYLEAFIKYANPYIKETSTGTGLQHINKNFFKDCKIPIPPTNEQKKIVAKLDGLMKRVHLNKDRLDKIPKILRRFRQSILSAAVSGKLTEEWRESNVFKNEIELKNIFQINAEYKALETLPENWLWVALGNYVKCERGRFSIRPRNDPKFFGGKIPFIQIGDLPKNGGVISNHIQTLNEDGLKVSKKFTKNTVVIAIVGATIGNTGILGYDMCFPDSLVGINTENPTKNLFIDFYLRLEKENLRQLSYAGGGQPNIKLELLNAYPLPLPPLAEQNEIVKRVDELFNFADKIEARYTKVKQQLEKLPQSILAKAFKGELLTSEGLENIESEAAILFNDLPEIKKPIAKVDKTQRAETNIKTYSLKPTTVHAGIIAKIIDAHVQAPQHTDKLGHIKVEKISHLIEYHLGIDLGRTSKKLAAGPADFPHLKKVEHHAKLNNWFTVSKIKDQSGYSYKKSSQFKKILTTIDTTLKDDLKEVEKLIKLFLPMGKEQAEVIATVYAAWNNFLIDGKKPTDEQIVKEARENWTKEKLNIDRDKFFKAIEWLRKKHMIPKGLGKKVM